MWFGMSKQRCCWRARAACSNQRKKEGPSLSLGSPRQQKGNPRLVVLRALHRPAQQTQGKKRRRWPSSCRRVWGCVCACVWGGVEGKALAPQGQQEDSAAQPAQGDRRRCCLPPSVRYLGSSRLHRNTLPTRMHVQYRVGCVMGACEAREGALQRKGQSEQDREVKQDRHWGTAVTRRKERLATSRRP